MRRLLALVGALVVGLGGCAVGPDYEAPVFEQGDSWQSKIATDASATPVNAAGWWGQFNDPLLSELIEKGAFNNRDLAVALANIERARGLRREAGAGYFPSIDVAGSASRSRYSRQTGFGANTGTRNTFTGSLDASWELDLFGRTRRSVEAAEAQIGASQAAHQGVMLSVAAEIAASYFELRGLQEQLEMNRRDIDLLKEVEAVAGAQAELGVTSGLDLARAQGERENIAAKAPNLEAQVMARIYRISVLTGEAPEFHAAKLKLSQPLPMALDRVPVGLRSQILKRRPDVRQAERELAAATAAIGIARADLFPDFSLTGAIGSSARLFSDLFMPGTLTSSLGAALGWPLFAGGAITARIDVAEADAKAALARYEQSVLLALEDAESALMAYAREWQTLKLLQAAEHSRLQAFEIARLRYEAGEEGFMVMLDAERMLITTRNDIVSSEIRILTGLTQLYKALGGGWQLVEQVNGEQQQPQRDGSATQQGADE